MENIRILSLKLLISHGSNIPSLISEKKNALHQLQSEATCLLPFPPLFCRQVFRISRTYFSMLLLDNRGVDRERFITPLASDQLFSYIDSFLLDEEERERLEHHKDFCDEPDEYL